MDLHVDIQELRQLEHDLGQVPARMVPKIVAVLKRGAKNIKDDWRDAWSGHAHIKHLPRAISYDINYGMSHISAEIGPDKEVSQGPLGSLIEYGSVQNAPIPGGAPALAKEEPKFFAQMEQLAAGVLDE